MGSKTPSVTTTSSAPPPEVMARYNQVMDRASSVAETPYSAYGGQLTAGQNQTQQAATQGLGAAAFLGNSFYNQGSSALGQAAKLVAGSQSYFQQGADQLGGAQPYYQQAAGYNAQSTGPLNISQYLSPYQQSVIDATMAQVHQSDAMAQNGALGNAIKTGNAFGGDRAGLAAAELERNQGMNRNSTIANLNNQNYAQALGAAQNEMARYGQAAQISAGLGSAQINAGQAMGALGSAQAGAGQGLGALGTSYGNMGTQFASTAREGYNAALAAGAQQQATEQAGLTAAYQQWQAAQQFPYAQTSWLSGIQSGLGSLSGGTGSTTAPAPNPMNQILGLGATAAGAFMASDERVKEDIKLIGKSFDGQQIYSYKYRGEPNTQIGLMAQEVEKDHPDAVRDIGGIKHVDYESATDDAADKGRFAQGGAVLPFGGAPSFIPLIQMTTGRGPPAAPKIAEEKKQDLSSLGAAAGKGLAGLGGPGDPMSLAAPGVQAGLGGVGPWVDPTAGLGGLYARGGGVPYRASGGLVPNDFTFEDRFGPAREAVADGTFDPQGSNYHTMDRASEFASAGFDPLASVPLPESRPAGLGAVAERSFDAPTYERAPARGLAAVGSLPRQITGGDDRGLPENVMAYDAVRSPPRAGLAPPAGYAPPVAGGVAPPESRQGSLGGLLPYLSQEAKASLMATGLALMSSRSPNLGNALGDAGQVGLGTYYGALSGRAATEAKAREADRDYSLQVRKLDESAADSRARLALDTRKANQIVRPDGSVVQLDGGAVRELLPAVKSLNTSEDIREYEYAKRQGFDGNFQEWVQRKRGGAGEYGMQPIFGADKDGNAVIMQLGKSGEAVQSKLPPGVSVNRQPIKVDMGTHTVLIDPITRQQIGQPIPKNIAEAAVAEEVGKAQGLARAGLGATEGKAELALKTIEQIRAHPGKNSIFGVGVLGGVGGIPGTEQKGFVTLIDQAKGQTFLQAFESLKGGGAITEIEGLKATQAMARLDRSQSKKDFDIALSDLESVIKAGVARARAKAGSPAANLAAAPADRSGAAPPGAVGMLRANPAMREDFDRKYGPGAAAKVLGK